jgi:hypothetical protein
MLLVNSPFGKNLSFKDVESNEENGRGATFYVSHRLQAAFYLWHY